MTEMAIIQTTLYDQDPPDERDNTNENGPTDEREGGYIATPVQIENYNIIDTSDVQFPPYNQGECVFSSLAFISSWLTGTQYYSGTFIHEYERLFPNSPITEEGIGINNVGVFVTHLFETLNENYKTPDGDIDVKSAIDDNHLCYAEVYDGSHAVVIVGYDNDGHYLFQDPQYQGVFRADEEFFEDVYIIGGIRQH
ncbi:MAG: hypothetical protein LBQ31_08100 [Bacteroidales bacterium]|nr:hypothetical protein [Bacteroidales bacterium]